MKKKICSICKINPKRYGSRCRDCNNEYTKNYYKKHPGIKKKLDYQYKRKIRLIALNHYSNGRLECKCCGEKEIDFLCLDHINNDGKIERAIMGIGIGFYQNLIKNNYKSKLQILCYNCNAGKTKHGGCPHKRT